MADRHAPGAPGVAGPAVTRAVCPVQREQSRCAELLGTVVAKAAAAVLPVPNLRCVRRRAGRRAMARSVPSPLQAPAPQRARAVALDVNSRTSCYDRGHAGSVGFDVRCGLPFDAERPVPLSRRRCSTAGLCWRADCWPPPCSSDMGLSTSNGTSSTRDYSASPAPFSSCLLAAGSCQSRAHPLGSRSRRATRKLRSFRGRSPLRAAYIPTLFAHPDQQPLKLKLQLPVYASLDGEEIVIDSAARRERTTISYGYSIRRDCPCEFPRVHDRFSRT